MARPHREVPPAFEGNDQMVGAVGAVAWAVALIVLLVLGNHLPPSRHWWIWTCVVGVGLGVFAVLYIPRLKRAREKAAAGPPAGGRGGAG